jgi:hypothetical protein
LSNNRKSGLSNSIYLHRTWFFSSQAVALSWTWALLILIGDVHLLERRLIAMCDNIYETIPSTEMHRLDVYIYHACYIRS